jgi:hypothetical protein
MKRGKIVSSLILVIFLIGIVSAANFCCEKTVGTNPSWCQNVNSEASCDANFQKTSAYCEATSYCKVGTCINQQEGTCMPSTKSVCEDNGGSWSSQPKSELPQCKNGCCLIGESASFVTQVACNRMSALYGLTVNFQAGTNTELSCLASANPNAKGACVYTQDYARTCSSTTKEKCQEKAKNAAFTDASFHEGYLCSAPELETNCAKSQITKCGDDDRVYFVDTCGNLANVYDSSKINDEKDYWTKIQEPTCSTTGNEGNKDSLSCGDCSYYSGSMCKQKKMGDTTDYGNYICKDLDCKTYRGKYSSSSTGMATAEDYPKHGESWCATDEKNGGNSTSPGATSFVLTCYNGEVNQPSECDATRQKVCKETIMNTETNFKVAGCQANIWQDCTTQNKSADCLNEEVRDCKWVTGTDWNGYYFTSEKGMLNVTTSSSPTGICVPKYQPGFTRDGTTDVVVNCQQATSVCYVKMQKWWLSGRVNPENAQWKCAPDTIGFKNNCSCLESTWEKGLNKICTSLGDCGNKTNYIGEFGYQESSIQIIEGNSTA